MSKGKSWELDNSLGQIKGTLFEPSDEDDLIDPELVLELKKKGVKFTEEDLLFVTKDSSGEIVFLEKGNPGAGLEHILYGDGEEKIGHLKELKNRLEVSEKEIPKELFKFIKYGKVIDECPSKKGGFDRVYEHNDKKIFFTIADNGFIVTAYPYKEEKNGN